MIGKSSFCSGSASLLHAQLRAADQCLHSSTWVAYRRLSGQGRVQSKTGWHAGACLDNTALHGGWPAGGRPTWLPCTPPDQPPLRLTRACLAAHWVRCQGCSSSQVCEACSTISGSCTVPSSTPLASWGGRGGVAEGHVRQVGQARGAYSLKQHRGRFALPPTPSHLQRCAQRTCGAAATCADKPQPPNCPPGRPPGTPAQMPKSR